MVSAGTSDCWPGPVSSKFRIKIGGGFTLVEVLAAAALLAIGLLAVLTAIQASRETQQRAIYISVARNIAQSEIDTARSTPFDSLDDYGNNYDTTSLPPGNKIIVEVLGYPTPTSNNLRRATVTVSWPEGQGTREVIYETLIARE